LICDHKSDILQEETTIKNNSFLDLIFDNSEFDKYQKNENMQFSRQNFEGKLICKNVSHFLFISIIFKFL